MNTDTLISFIIPVYNTEKTLARCLDSILNQSLKCFEIILVNDASDDNSPEIINHYEKNYPGIITSYIQPNMGAGKARNTGMKKARGEYLAFVDSDDYIEPGYLEVVKDKIDRFSPDMVMIGYNRVYEKKQTFLERLYPFSKWDLYDTPVSLASHPELITGIEGATWLRIIRRSLFTGNEDLYFSKRYLAEDQEASLKWFLAAKKIIVCRERLYNYVISNSSINFSTHSIGDFTEIIDSVCSYYKRAARFDDYHAELELLFIKQLLISNLRRLYASRTENSYKLFMSLRSSLIRHFPEFHRNPYLKKEPVYIRLAVFIAGHFPGLFKLIL